MRFAYADPVYLGCGRLYVKDHPNAKDWDSVDTHRGLIATLVEEYPNGWALSCSSPSLYTMQNILENMGLHSVDGDYRIASWMKPFAIFKPGVGLAYTWEPVIVMGGRKIGRSEPTAKDHLVCNITLQKGLTGVKPMRFNEWVLAMLNVQPGDTLDDLFPGKGGMGAAVAKRLAVQPEPLELAVMPDARLRSAMTTPPAK